MSLDRSPDLIQIEPVTADWKLIPVQPPTPVAVPRGELLVAQAGHGTAPGHEGAEVAAPGGEHAGVEATAHDGHHGEGPVKYLMPHELPNVATLLEFGVFHRDAELYHGARPHPSSAWFINPLFSIFYALVIVWIVRRALRRPNIERPGKLQNAVEMLLGGLQNLFVGIMGPVGRKFVPYLGTLWLFIWFNNLAGIVPGLKSPSSSVKTTFALGILTFFYVQFNAIKYSGFKGWIYHLLGSPKDVVTWCLSPLFFFLEVIGELVKPVSLSLRLFGNIFGEDKLLASFLGMGMMLIAAIFGTARPVVGVPLQLPFYFLVLLMSTIQATVFSLLASIYILLLLPHEHEHEHEEHAHGAVDEAHAGAADQGRTPTPAA